MECFARLRGSQEERQGDNNHHPEDVRSIRCVEGGRENEIPDIQAPL